ncbi:SRPBCC family protein [Rhodoferax sp. BAB1]|nr:SRPBCC family protein [Rhodoferax sp. BAB1]
MSQQRERHAEAVALIHAAPEQIFARLDDQRRLAAHMTKASWMTLGSKFNFELDQFQGHRVGSVIRMNGRVAGIELGLDEIVNGYEPPLRKAWATLGEPRLLVIGAYRMGFNLAAEGQGARLQVWIDYQLPSRAALRWLGWLLGPVYASWCVREMVEDARRGF